MSPLEESLPQLVMFVYLGLVGACLGSFAHVLVCRLPRSDSWRTILLTPSACLNCGARLRWRDLIPLLSFFALRGKCRSCGYGFAGRYVLFEGLMALLLPALWGVVGPSYQFWLWLPLLPLLLAIAFLDIDYFWIPDALLLPAFLWVLGVAAAASHLWAIEMALALLPGALLYGLGVLMRWLRRQEMLGLGDVKLLTLLSLAMGDIQGSLWVMLWAALQGLVVGVVLIARGGHRGAYAQAPYPGAPVLGASSADEPGQGAADQWQPPKTAIPFGPFLILAALQWLLLPQGFAAATRRLVATFGFG